MIFSVFSINFLYNYRGLFQHTNVSKGSKRHYCHNSNHTRCAYSQLHSQHMENNKILKRNVSGGDQTVLLWDFRGRGERLGDEAQYPFPAFPASETEKRYKKKNLCIWLCWVLVAARGVLVGMWRSTSSSRDWNFTTGIGSVAS